jgi:sec-independent protein translocase protein TatA
MFGLGTGELLLIVVVLLLLFNGRLPAVGESFGAAIRKFKRALHQPDEIDVTPLDDRKDADTGKRSADGGRGARGGD